MRRVHNRQQVIDFKCEIIGQAIDVGSAVVIDEQLEQAGDSTGAGVGKHLVVHLPLVPCRQPLGYGGGRHVGPREHLIDVVDQLGEGGALAVARLAQRYLEIHPHMPRVAAQHDDAISQK